MDASLSLRLLIQLDNANILLEGLCVRELAGPNLPLYAAVEEEIGYCHHHGKLRLDLEWLAHSSTSARR